MLEEEQNKECDKLGEQYKEFYKLGEVQYKECYELGE